MTDDLHVKFRRSSVYILIQKLITPTLTFGVTIFLVRRLSVDDYGVFNIMEALMAYIGLFSSLGLLNIFKRFIPEFAQQGQSTEMRKLVFWGMAARGVLVLTFLAVCFFWSEPIGRLLRLEGYGDYLSYFALAILFYLESQLLGLALVSLFLHRSFALAQIIYTVFRSVLVVGLVLIGLNLQGLLIGESVAYGVLLLLQVWEYRKRALPDHAMTPGRGQPFPMRRISRFAGFAYFNEMGEQILDVSTDFFIISAILGAESVGLYAFATRFMNLISRWLPHRLLIDVITPTFYTRYSQEKAPETLNTMFNFLNKMVGFFIFPLTLYLVLMGDKIIALVYSEKYLAALTVFAIAASFQAVNAFEMPLGLVVQAMERVEIHLYSKVFSVYNLVGNLLVIHHWGIEGVALVTCSAILFKNVFTYFSIRRHVAIRLQAGPLLRILRNTALLAPLAWLAHPLITSLPLLILISMGLAGAYLVIAALLPVFTAEEKNQVNRFLPKPWFIF